MHVWGMLFPLSPSLISLALAQKHRKINNKVFIVEKENA